MGMAAKMEFPITSARMTEVEDPRASIQYPIGQEISRKKTPQTIQVSKGMEASKVFA
jgi:hypothetical protein